MFNQVYNVHEYWFIGLTRPADANRAASLTRTGSVIEILDMFAYFFGFISNTSSQSIMQWRSIFRNTGVQNFLASMHVRICTYMCKSNSIFVNTKVGLKSFVCLDASRTPRLSGVCLQTTTRRSTPSPVSSRRSRGNSRTRLGASAGYHPYIKVSLIH